ncbi:hypothetical protein [Zunongwangia sp. HGR-M22]|uniref:hypothetical protein n=1 Tax=Zunongwangia sp. HGR-M22 TaxID=3015168 RepID=UPI002FD785E9
MKISLKQRKLKSGKISLSIEYYKGSETTPEGKRRHIRENENLKLFLHDEPKNAIERKENKETLALAKKILAIREAEFYQGRFDLKIQLNPNVVSWIFLMRKPRKKMIA